MSVIVVVRRLDGNGHYHSKVMPAGNRYLRFHVESSCLQNVIRFYFCLTRFGIINSWLDAAVGLGCVVRLYITFNYQVATVFLVK